MCEEQLMGWSQQKKQPNDVYAHMHTNMQTASHSSMNTHTHTLTQGANEADEE